MLSYLDYLQSPVYWTLFASALFATLVLTPAAMRLARALGAVDRGGYRKVFEGAMPLMGGFGVAVPFVAVCLLGVFNPLSIFGELTSSRSDLIALAIGCVAIVVVGMLDDSRGMRARHKFLAQIAIALFICASGSTMHSISLPLVGRIELGFFLGTALTVAWIVGITNAFNIIDGLDGLASGIALIGSVALGIVAAINGATFVVVLCVALAGSLLAFLMYNFHPARIFLGDTGSLFLGFALANISLMGSYKTTGTVVFLAPMLALGFPIFETLISMARRYAHGLPIFAGDSRHTHHRLLKRGLSQRQVVVTLYAGAFACLAAAVTSALLPMMSWVACFPVVLYGLTVSLLGWFAGYSARLDGVSERRQRNSLLSAFSQYAAKSLSSEACSLSVDEVLGIVRLELGLRCLEVAYADGGRIVGTSMDGEADLSEAAMHLKVDTADGNELFISYEHQSGADVVDHERHDVAACLAGIFDGLNLSAPSYGKSSHGAASGNGARRFVQPELELSV